MSGREHAPRRGSMVRNFIHLGLGQATTTILTILLSATLARSLGAADFGLLFLVMSIATFAYVIVDWGHGNLIIRETARARERAGDLIGSAFAVRSVTALAVCAGAVATTWLLGYDARTRMLTGVLILCWLPQYLGLSFGWVFRAYERMDRDALLNIVLKLVTLLGSIACLALGGHLLGLMFAWSIAGCLTLAMGMFSYKRLRLPTLTARLSTVRELLRDGAPIFAITLASAVEFFFNANILYKMASAEVVGWYGAAWNIAGTLIAPATILGAAMYPRLSTAAGDFAAFKRAFDVSFRPLFLLAVLGAIGTYEFADVAVGLIYNLEKFGPAADTLRAFVPVMLLMYVDVFLSMAILAAGKAGRLAIAKVAAVVLTVGLDFVLVPLCQTQFGNGGLGVMYAMAIGELVMLLTFCFLIREALDRHTIAVVSRTLIAGGVTVVLIRSLPTFTPFLAVPLCVLLFLVLSALAGAINQTDLKSLLASFRKRAPR